MHPIHYPTLRGTDPTLRGTVTSYRWASSEMRKILFLCTGNYYRSRYAEEVFNHLATCESVPWRAVSRGAAERGAPNNIGPVSQFALDALGAKKIVPKSAMRQPQSCSFADFREADLVIALKEAEHRPIIERRFPAFAHRVKYWHVDDIDFSHPSIALPMIDDHVRTLVAALKQSPA